MAISRSPQCARAPNRTRIGEVGSVRASAPLRPSPPFALRTPPPSGGRAAPLFPETGVRHRLLDSPVATPRCPSPGCHASDGGCQYDRSGQAGRSQRDRAGAGAGRDRASRADDREDSGERARAEVVALLRRFGCESVGFMDNVFLPCMLTDNGPDGGRAHRQGHAGSEGQSK